MKKLIKTFGFLACMAVCCMAQKAGAAVRFDKAMPSITWDSRSLMVDGRRVAPVMGEVHYSRIPAEEWEASVRKMKEGGVTIIATYVFWNHIEELENQFDWSGQRNLRRFLEVCKKEQMPVVLRIGPFCHGEVRCGGIPDWFFTKGIKSRSEDPRFLAIVENLYRQIFTQVQGLQWKDGGPIVACQFDNEYRGRGSYLMALKNIALNVGFDLPFYTRTGWPELATPVPYGEMLPLYGDYADGFWERSIKPTAGNYYKAFFFKSNRDSKSIASEQIKYGNGSGAAEGGDGLYPYFTCELGGGMMSSYHRRLYMYDDDAYAMAVVKLGSGSNLLGYYMYHGGTNPEGKLTYLNETQRTAATNYNDLPVKTYDFQAPLGEFGQRNTVYYRLRPLHLFMNDFGEELAPMDAVFPNTKEAVKGDNSYLRWSYRTADGKSGYVFFNNYERLQNLTAKKGVRFEVCGVKFPSVTVPAGAIGILPVRVAGIKYATAQLVANRDGKIYLMQIEGMPSQIAFEDGKVIRNAKPLGKEKPIYKNYYLLTQAEAGCLGLSPELAGKCGEEIMVSYEKRKAAGPLRTITIGVNKVAEEPVDADFDDAAVYEIKVPAGSKGLLSINYHGDCARLYANGKLIGDNFYNGRPFLYGLWRLPEGTASLELRILPMQEGAPVYFPKEANTAPGEGVNGISVLQ